MTPPSSPRKVKKGRERVCGRSEKGEEEDFVHGQSHRHKVKREKSESSSGDEDCEDDSRQTSEKESKDRPKHRPSECGASSTRDPPHGKGRQDEGGNSEEDEKEDRSGSDCDEESENETTKPKPGISHGRACEKESSSDDDSDSDASVTRCKKSEKKKKKHRDTKSEDESYKHCTRHDGTSKPGSHSNPAGSTRPAGKIPEWCPYTDYKTDDRVQYEGVIYICSKDHTSRPIWVPPKVINLWEPSGSSTGTDDEEPDPLKLPYASELFGVYQPLVGWRSELSHERLSLAVAKRIREAVRYGKSIREQTVPRLHAVDRTGTEFGRAMAALASDGHKKDSINTLLLDSNPKFKSTLKNIHEARSLRAGNRAPGDGPIFNPPDTSPNPARDEEAIMAQVLKRLNEDAPDTVKQLFRPSVSRYERAIGAATFMGSPHKATDVYLSPIGILHQFREYFFHLGTFLGPPVGHVWISPGSSVELVESNTRRKLVERSMEQTLNTVSKSETATTEKDELSDAVKVENSNDMRLGVSATASGGVGSVFHASGTASFDLANSRKQAQEQTHKKMREQSAKLTNEVTQNFKTTFRTVTETTDTSSRRYVLQNQSTQLVSFELSRKMRKVGVQVQDLGQRLCFQLFIDNPGDPLGVGEFVHSAAEALDPSIKPSEEEMPPGPKLVTHPFEFPYIVTQGDKQLNADFYPNPENANGGKHHDTWDIGADYIDFRREFKLGSPPDGYHLLQDSIKQVEFKGSNVTYKPEYNLDIAKSLFYIHLTYANFGGKEQMPFNVLVEYAPNQETIDRIKEKNKQNKKVYDDQVAAAKEKSFYETLRARLKLSSQIRPRSFDVLREEERHVIYQRIIHRLYGHEDGFGSNDYYAAAEMIRYFFDIDALLYFVAPDWWKPRTASVPKPNKDQPIPASATSPSIATRVSLKYKNVDADVTTRATYLMTEETEPAPLGASLGWIMQVDGDQHRNAFLNSPWVKAVLPIRPGRELDAIGFLQRKEVAGIDGLDQHFPGDGSLGPRPTLKDILLEVAQEIRKEYETSQVLKPVGKDKVLNPGGKKLKMALPSEMVFARGYNPLEGGIDFGNGAFEVFSEWSEILPTDQVVATEYPSRTPSD